MVPDILRGLLSRVPPHRPAVLQDHLRCLVRGQSFPAVISSAGSNVEGLLIEGLLPREMRALDYYEDEEYTRKAVTVMVDGDGYSGLHVKQKEVRAACYIWPLEKADLLDRSTSWSKDEFCNEKLLDFMKEVIAPVRREFDELNPLPCEIRRVSQSEAIQFCDQALRAPVGAVPDDAAYFGAFHEVIDLVGMLAMARVHDQPHTIRLLGIAVVAEEQGRGVGASLVARAKAEALNNGARRLVCEVPSDYVGFLQRVGMSVTSSEERTEIAQVDAKVAMEMRI